MKGGVQILWPEINPEGAEAVESGYAGRIGNGNV